MIDNRIVQIIGDSPMHPTTRSTRFPKASGRNYYAALAIRNPLWFALLVALAALTIGCTPKTASLMVPGTKVSAAALANEETQINTNLQKRSDALTADIANFHAQSTTASDDLIRQTSRNDAILQVATGIIGAAATSPLTAAGLVGIILNGGLAIFAAYHATSAIKRSVAGTTLVEVPPPTPPPSA
jgi:hypothetical protein